MMSDDAEVRGEGGPQHGVVQLTQLGDQRGRQPRVVRDKVALGPVCIRVDVPHALVPEPHLLACEVERS